MKKLYVLLLAIFLFANINSNAQRHEFGLFLGTSYYLGDINEGGQFAMTSPAFGMVYRYAINQRWALKVNGFMGTIQADDKVTGTKDTKARNLSFKSSLTEISAQLELHFFEYEAGSQNHRFTPLLFAGLSAFHFNPKAEFQGEWFELQPLGTEGQNTTEYTDRKPYKLTQMAIPFGIGFKWNVSHSVTLGFEWGIRKTFTDYLDDVSTTYADPSVLSSESGPYSMVLGNRIFEESDLFNNGWGEPFAPIGDPNPEGFKEYPREMAAALTGFQRGTSTNNDWYSF
nr:outer membrane beta-barrel protein [Bacteroidota bacterium]